MRRTSWFLRATAHTGLLASLWLNTAVGRAQEPVTPLAHFAPAPDDVLVLPTVNLCLPPPILDLELEPDADVATEDDAEPVLPSPWARVPPVRIFPRPGAFTILPSGPGYYSFRDFLEGRKRPKPPASAYPPFGFMQPSFFDADFRYLENPANDQHDLFDPLKRMHVGDEWLWSLGGEFRYRYEYGRNNRLALTADGPAGPRLRNATRNDYDLTRVRMYSDLWYQDKFRVFVEYLDAASVGEELTPLPIEENRSELLNAFVDLKLGEPGGKGAYLRVGRQELLLGSQRLISPLDWANTRRTFQGVRAFHQGDQFDVDFFWVQPVVPFGNRFDSVDNDVNLAGAWFTYRPKKGTFVDLYYLFLDNTTPNAPPSPLAAAGTKLGAQHFSTVGFRYAGDRDGRYLWDVEAMYQFGERGAQTISAGAVTTGAGYRFAETRMAPQLWLYYDYASGDRNPGSGTTFSTFNQIFPFGHYYLGFLDAVGRQNIHDVNAQFVFYPTPWITCLLQGHHYQLASARAGLFNAAGILTRIDPTGQAGTQVGNELDLLVNFHLDAHQDLLLGYSRLFPGRYIRETGSGATPDFFYAQYQYRW